jgi:hypothetical protein
MGEHMTASKKQIALIEELQTRGTLIPENDHGNPDNSMFESVRSADSYIKQWGHLMRQHSTSMRADEWGGIPNTGLCGCKEVI